MTRLRSFSEEEERLIAALLSEIQEDASFERPLTVDDLLDRWMIFVKEVEKGYTLSVYDYTNDLMIRDHIDQVVGALREKESRGAVLEALQPWDDRFRLATRPSAIPIAPGVESVDRSWWFRVPRKLSGELEEDLRSEGIV